MAWVPAVVLALAFALLLQRGLHSPHLVGAAIPLTETEILLLTSQVDRPPVWMVYGIDGTPRQPWGRRPLPGGIVERPDGTLRDPAAKPEPLERVVASMSRLVPGQTRFFIDSVGDRSVQFRDPPGILIERLGHSVHGDDRLERVDLNGTLVWSASLKQLLGDVDFEPYSTELRHAHLQATGRITLLVVQAVSSSAARPVETAVSRIVTVDSSSGRVIRRSDIQPP